MKDERAAHLKALGVQVPTRCDKCNGRFLHTRYLRAAGEQQPFIFDGRVTGEALQHRCQACGFVQFGATVADQITWAGGVVAMLESEP